MKLLDLDPQFLGTGGTGVSDSEGEPVPHRPGVGLSLKCPCGCESPMFAAFANPLDEGPPIPGTTWDRTGDTFETLTLRPSILRRGGCGWHGFITNGEAVECT